MVKTIKTWKQYCNKFNKDLKKKRKKMYKSRSEKQYSCILNKYSSWSSESRGLTIIPQNPTPADFQASSIKLKVAHPQARWSQSEILFLASVPGYPQHISLDCSPLTCPSLLSMAIILPSHTPDTSRSGRVWKARSPAGWQIWRQTNRHMQSGKLYSN